MPYLKSENKWVSSGSLDSIKLDIEGLKAVQRNELIVPGFLYFMALIGS